MAVVRTRTSRRGRATYLRRSRQPTFRSAKKHTMNAAHLHLIITHAPVTIVAIGMFLLMLAAIRGSDESKRSAFLLFTLAAVIAVIAYVTGQPATQQLKANVGAIPMDEIDRHAEIAVVA